MTEAEVVDISVRANDLDRDVTRAYTELDRKISAAWDQYMDGTMATTHFLKVVSRLYRPSDNLVAPDIHQ